MTVDLRTCVPGQLVELRDGRIVRYVSKNHNIVYPHFVNDSSYTDDGYYYLSREEDEDDVVKIFPLAKPEQLKSDKHPSVAWWDSCPWITDRKPTALDGDTYGRVYMKSAKNRAIIFNWNDVGVHKHWIHLCGWQPLKQTPKKKALALIANHKDGWVPTPDEWDIICEGLTE